MVAYADWTYYSENYMGRLLKGEDALKYLSQATMHINILTYNRITDFEALTDFQKDVIKTCCCKIADFEYENEDILQSVFKSYGINGVSMTFGESWNVTIINGVALPRDIYNILRTTGLCCRVIR